MLIAAVIGLLSLRLRTIFFSMITLAVASFAQIVAEQWRSLTGGEDGLTFAVPAILQPGFRLFSDPVMGVMINGRVITYYITFAVALVLFLIMLRIVNSPFGLVLRAIRENEFRVEAMGYRVVAYRTWVCIISAVMASLAGGLMALVLRYNGPEATLSFSLMIDILLMIVIGGMGTLYGAVVGSIVVVLAEYYLENALSAVSSAMTGMPLMSALFHPDRWLLWLGILFVLIVTFLPQEIVGRLRRPVARAPDTTRENSTRNAAQRGDRPAPRNRERRLVVQIGGSVTRASADPAEPLSAQCSTSPAALDGAARTLTS